MLLPFGAAYFITTDFPLAALQTLAVYAFIESRFGSGRHPQRWLWLMWAAYAAAFLSKGPPALLPLLATMALQWLAPSPQPRRWLLLLSGLVIFLVLTLPWFIAVTIEHPGLLHYFLGVEVVDRIASGRFQRHAQWYGWLQVYGPTLLLGTLPWTPALWRWARTLPASLRCWLNPALRRDGAPLLLLTLWLLIPLLVFCVVRSRLPLYLLPLFVPLALLAARQRHAEGRDLPAWPQLALWAALLLGLRLATAHWPTHKNAALWAEEIQTRTPVRVHEVVFVEDMARYGLRLYLDAEIRKISLGPVPLDMIVFNPVYDGDAIGELREHDPGVVYICKQGLWPQLQEWIAARGHRAVALGASYRDRVIFQVQPQPP
ncbi:MAG: glycosyltransferase [Gammaproteobacteria bacterium]|nr:glycosyltransferase [Gammaproteobacteria bacterium]